METLAFFFYFSLTFLSDFEQVWMWRNNLGGRGGIYRKQQPIGFRLVAARVFVCMAPVACAAAPRALHGLMHDLVARFATPPATQDDHMSGCMTGVHASQHNVPYMSARMRRLHARRNLVLRRHSDFLMFDTVF